jgi:hypothetical protein
MLPDDSATIDLTGAQCTVSEGRFTAETRLDGALPDLEGQPGGVFSPINPLVK